MRSAGDEVRKVTLCGRVGTEYGAPALRVIDEVTGEAVPLVVSTGSLVPTNWHGKRVRVTVERLDE